MFFLILFSVLQICFLPGFIVFLFLNKRSDNVNLLLVPVYSFGLSLIINYIIVTCLAYFHIYTRLSLSILLTAEFIFLAVVFVFHKLNIDSLLSRKMSRDIVHEIKIIINERKSVSDLMRFIFFILSVSVLIFMVIVLISDIGKIFRFWDAIFSWNIWAIDFYNNKIPSVTYHYPQLIPANWSISYVMCGYPLQFIPKGLMPLFLIIPVYSFIVIGLTQRSYGFIYSVFFLFQGFHRLHWTDGCADVPVAFFSMLILISLIVIRKQDSEADKQKQVMLSSLFVCGAAVTKQAGLFILGVYPLLLYILTKESYPGDLKKKLKQGFFFLTMAILIVVPYYLYAEFSIRNGTSESEITYVTNEIYKGASYAERFLSACALFFKGVFTSKMIFIIAILPFLLSFTNRTFRLLNIVFLFPYFVIWALFFSYDLRNAAIMIPYLCLGIGAGLDIILQKLNTTFIINESTEK